MIRSTTAVLLLAVSATAADPNFERQVIDDQISIGYGLAIGDVDGDGKPDILLADKSQIAWYRNGDWKRFNIAEHLNPPVGARHRDNVCIAARDIDGDGKVEIAGGGQWNPGETSDATKSGSVHYLMRPEDPTQKWKPVRLHHEPTLVDDSMHATHNFDVSRPEDDEEILTIAGLEGCKIFRYIRLRYLRPLAYYGRE